MAKVRKAPKGPKVDLSPVDLSDIGLAVRIYLRSGWLSNSCK
jgi:hypothetical protein